MSGVVWVAAVVVLAAVVMFALRRELARLERERRLAAALTPIARAFDEFKREVGIALLPALREMTEALTAMQPQIRRLVDSMSDEGKR